MGWYSTLISILRITRTYNCDDDGDRNLDFLDISLSFYSKYDNGGQRHQKCCRDNDLAVTVNDAAPWSGCIRISDPTVFGTLVLNKILSLH